MTDPSSVPADLARAAVLATARRAAAPEVAGVGLRTHSFRMENLSEGRLPRAAEEFLTASRLRRWDRQTQLSIASYGSDAMALAWADQDAEQLPRERVLPLPEGPQVEESFTSVVARRRSGRLFADAPVEAGRLAAVLRHCASATAVGEVETDDGAVLEGAFHAVPSAGGLRPVQLWVAARRVDGLPAGIHRYLPGREALAAHGSPDDVRRLLEAFQASGDGPDPARAAAVLLFVARPWRSMRKYGDRGMRFVLHETGAMAEHAHLAATGLDLASVDFSGFYDDEANDALGVDGVLEALLHSVLIAAPGQ